MRTLERFRSLARRFRCAAECGDIEEMDALLTERRRLLLRLQERPGGGTSREGLLVEILACDRESEAILEEQRAQLRKELVTLGRGRRGLSAYGPGDRTRAKWIDERG